MSPSATSPYTHIHLCHLSLLFSLHVHSFFFAEPKPPSNVTLTITGSDSAMVSWTASQSMCDDVVGNYSVRYRLRDGTGANTTVYINKTSVTLQDLIPNAEYVVSVAAINSRGNMSAFSVEMSFTVSTPTTLTGGK